METTVNPTPEMISLASIQMDGGTQSRSEISKSVVSEYAEAMKAGAHFPPVIVFHDGAANWLADGFHRCHAAREAGQSEIPATVHSGTRRDAMLYSAGANAAHGHRRTPEDKRNAVTMLLQDAEWGSWSNSEIARRASVSHTFVATVRASLETASSEERTYITRHGTEALMKTAAIGRKGEAKQGTTESDPLQDACKNEPPLDARFRKGLSTLTRDALEDDVAGLRANLADAKATIKKLETENRRLKDLNKSFEGDQAETIRRMANTIRHKSSEMYRANDKAAAAQRQVYVLKKRVKELEDMGIML